MRCGYVALLGRPNVGKSSLCNRLVGEDVAIVTAKPQTTRQRIAGIFTDAAAQIIFLDTPGVHRTRSKINAAMVEWAELAAEDADLCCVILGDQGIGSIEQELWESLDPEHTVVIINKIDQRDLETQAKLVEQVQLRWKPRHLYSVSARNGHGCDELLQHLTAAMPEGPALYPDDEYTDMPLRFLAAELVRKALFEQLRDEIPYGAAVEIDTFREEEKLTRIQATVLIERDSQKRIVVGQKGAMIREIGTQARHDIEALVGTKVYLELFVKVQRDWASSDYHLQRLGLVAAKS